MPWVVMGVYGVAYRVSMFQEDVFQEVQGRSRDCFLNDDVWISWYLKNKGVPILVLPIFPGGAHTRRSTWSPSVLEGMQTVSLRDCARSYGLS